MGVTISLADLLFDLQFAPEETELYVDRVTGETVAITQEARNHIEEETPFDDLAEWEQKDIELCALVTADNGSRFVRLPEKDAFDEERREGGEKAVRALAVAWCEEHEIGYVEEAEG
ncbi:MAG: hypothetical protein ACODAJ_07090 [Planctomycetota bacterium]